jgi:hypothetical protein
MSSVDGTCRKSIAEKVMLAGGAASLALASGTAAEGAVVSALNTPISPPVTLDNDFFIPWDIDGDNVNDFELMHSFTSTSSNRWAQLGELGANRFVAPRSVISDGFAKLTSGFEVGYSMTGHHFPVPLSPQISITYNGAIDTDASSQGWSLGDIGYFGFKFTSGGNIYYGWGEIDIHGSSPGSGFTITKAYYDNTPGASITVGDTGGAIPEPSTCALALLAAGGVAAYRSRRKQAAV